MDSDTQTIDRREFEKVVEALIASGFEIRHGVEGNFETDSGVLWSLLVENIAGSAQGIIIDRLTELDADEA